MSIKTYRHTQTNPSVSWVVYHAMGRTPSFDVMIKADDGTMQKAYPASITHTSLNAFTLTWTTPRAGFVSVTALV